MEYPEFFQNIRIALFLTERHDHGAVDQDGIRVLIQQSICQQHRILVQSHCQGLAHLGFDNIRGLGDQLFIMLCDDGIDVACSILQGLRGIVLPDKYTHTLFVYIRGNYRYLVERIIGILDHFCAD